MPTEAVRVRGLKELQRDLRKVSREVEGDLRTELKRLGEPVRVEAERLAQAQGWGDKWSRARVGYASGIVYVAPAARRTTGTPRRNFGVLMMTREFMPAVENKRADVEAGVEKMLDRLFDRHDL